MHLIPQSLRRLTTSAFMAALILSTLVLSSLPLQAGEYDWVVKNTWNASIEKKFSEFVRIMGESGCRSMTACLTSKTSNPFYAQKTPKGKPFPADCADLPYALRLYFSWMEGLTFDYVNQPVQADPENETNTDIRYSKFGNRPGKVRRFELGKTYDAYKELMNLRDSVSTATYRMHYQYNSDLYPTKIDQKNIIPGTVAYDPAGHAAIIYKVENDGRLRMMDAHPDNSVTRITYDEKFARSRPAHGAGLRNWRPELNQDSSDSLPGFSTSQFEKSYVLGAETVSYYDWVRSQMAGGSLMFEPVLELKNKMKEVCMNLQDRRIAVESALRAGVHLKPHPDKLPVNIYGTNGEWEEYSTPSRDARLKVALTELRKEVERYVQLFEKGSSRVKYIPVASKFSTNCNPNDRKCFLMASLKSAYSETAAQPECSIQYKNSQGQDLRLNYSQIVGRLFQLSFDPYHCSELRWGATSAPEISSCQDDTYKRDWFTAQQGLRNQIERTYDLRMDYGLEDTAKLLGAKQGPEVDLWKYLNQL